MNQILVSKIQRFSLEDGSGIRTTVFLKGCNFRCVWCHNPESLVKYPILGVDVSRCDGCRRCIPMCPQEALSMTANTITVDRNRCNNCGICVPECYRQVFSLCGNVYTPASLVATLQEDISYFERSNGGVTFSGGEPLCQLQGLVATLKLCKQMGIHTILQTNLSLPFEQTIPYVDHYMIDIKLVDDEKHRAWVGEGTGVVLRNILVLDTLAASYEVRTPVIPQCNDTKDDILEIVGFLKRLHNVKRYRLLGYHPLGIPKYTQFGIPIQYNSMQGMDSSILNELQQLAEEELHR